MVNLCLHSLPSVMSYCSLGVTMLSAMSLCRLQCHIAACDVTILSTVSHCMSVVLHHCLCFHIFVFVTPSQMQFFVTHCCVVSHYYTRCHISVCNVALLSVMTYLFLSSCYIALCCVTLVSACSITSMLSALL